MATAQLQRLFNNARVKIPGAIDDMLKLELYNVLFEFFTDSNIWQDQLAVPVTTATATYTLTPSDTSQITRLMSVNTSATNGSLQVFATMQVPGTMILKNTPTVADTLVVVIAKTVIDPVSSGSPGDDPIQYGFPNYPTWVVDKYFLGILDGLIGQMMAQTAKPWTNEKLAVFHLRKFQQVITTARNEANRMNVFGAQRWTYPQSFGVAAKGMNAFGP